MEKNNEKKLKPIVYTSNYFKRGYQNTTQQMFLLDALKITQDPKKLRELIGVKTVAEVYRTLDKLAMRKEYHGALAKLGISFDYIAGGIKDLADSSEKENVRLKAFEVLLKSVGMDKYEDSESSAGGSWEEVLMAKIDEDKEKEKEGLEIDSNVDTYDVKFPVVPQSAKDAQDEEDEMTSSIYDTDLSKKDEKK